MFLQKTEENSISELEMEILAINQAFKKMLSKASYFEGEERREAIEVLGNLHQMKETLRDRIRKEEKILLPG